MEDEDLKEKFISESRQSHYPYERKEIRERYKDTSLELFKKRSSTHRGSFLSFGSRRSSLISSYGNTPTFMRRSLSSNGNLEYTVEQIPPRWNAGRGLPSITAEEREEEIDLDVDKEIPLIDSEPKVETNNISNGFDSESKSSVRIPSERKGSVSSSATLQASIAESSATLEEETDYIPESKNRKSFLHYDMPISSRKASLKSNDTPELQNNDRDPYLRQLPQRNMIVTSLKKTSLKEALDFESTLKENDLGKHKAVVNSLSNQSLDTTSISANKHEEMDDIIDSLRKSLNALSELEKSLATNTKKPVFPDINSTDKTEEPKPLVCNEQTSASPILPAPSKKLFVNSFNQPYVFRESVSSPPKDTHTTTEIKFLDCVSNLSPRKSSLKLHRRSREKGNHSDSDSSKYSDCLSSFNSLREKCDEGNESFFFPPLISRSGSEDEKRTAEADLATLPLVIANDICNSNSMSTKPNYKNEDSSRIGLQSLATDQTINKSFIVVHRKESNSLGLAPLTRNDSPAEDSGLSRQYSLPVSSKQKALSKNKKILDSVSSKYDLKISESHQNEPTKHIYNEVVQHKPNYLFSHGLIKSIPYDDSLRVASLNGENLECTLNANASRLCVLM